MAVLTDFDILRVLLKIRHTQLDLYGALISARDQDDPGKFWVRLEKFSKSDDDLGELIDELAAKVSEALK